MLLLRLFLFLSLITGTVSIGIYLFTKDRRYLRFAWQIGKLCLVLLVVVALFVLMRRIILF